MNKLHMQVFESPNLLSCSPENGNYNGSRPCIKLNPAHDKINIDLIGSSTQSINSFSTKSNDTATSLLSSVVGSFDFIDDQLTNPLIDEQNSGISYPTNNDQAINRMKNPMLESYLLSECVRSIGTNNSLQDRDLFTPVKISDIDFKTEMSSMGNNKNKNDSSEIPLSLLNCASLSDEIKICSQLLNNKKASTDREIPKFDRVIGRNISNQSFVRANKPLQKSDAMNTHSIQSSCEHCNKSLMKNLKSHIHLNESNIHINDMKYFSLTNLNADSTSSSLLPNQIGANISKNMHTNENIETRAPKKNFCASENIATVISKNLLKKSQMTNLVDTTKKTIVANPNLKNQPQRQVLSATANVKLYSYCTFCKNNGESEAIYSTHYLKDASGVVTCPILRAYTCPICGQNGDKAHTVKYCPIAARLAPKDAPVRSEMRVLRTARTSAGKRRFY